MIENRKTIVDIVTFIDSDDILEKAIETEKVYKIDMFW